MYAQLEQDLLRTTAVEWVETKYQHAAVVRPEPNNIGALYVPLAVTHRHCHRHLHYGVRTSEVAAHNA